MQSQHVWPLGDSVLLFFRLGFEWKKAIRGHLTPDLIPDRGTRCETGWCRLLSGGGALHESDWRSAQPIGVSVTMAGFVAASLWVISFLPSPSLLYCWLLVSNSSLKSSAHSPHVASCKIIIAQTFLAAPASHLFGTKSGNLPRKSPPESPKKWNSVKQPQ